jgi:alpha-amylase
VSFSLLKKLQAFLTLFLFISFLTTVSAQDFLMQGWYWDYPKYGCNGYSGDNWAVVLQNKVTELKNAGFTHLWLPPLSRASFGNCSNGYDPKDLYDLGEYGLGRTGFGTRTELNQLITSLSPEINAVADVVYNHRDGGKAENNPALKNYIDAFDWNRANTGYNPFPYDRYRVILPVGGATGNGVGDYYFKISSVSGHNRFNNFQYNVYMQTNKKGWQNLTALSETEPNGGSDCGQSNNDIQLGRDMNAIVDDPTTCRTDEFHLYLTSDDYFSTGDTIFIYFGKRNSDYSDMRVYGIWSGSRSQNIVNELIYQTYTDFTNMPSGLGSMTYQNFKPNSTNPTKLDGNWDWPWFFYDYDQNVPSTKSALFDWTRWLWNDIGIRGLRMDAVKHFPPEFVGDLLDNLHSNGIDPSLVVGEFYDGNPAALKNWIDQVYTYMDDTTKLAIVPRVFDFSLRYELKNACDGDANYDVRNVFNASITDATGLAGFNIVTFVGNHDFRESGQYIANDPILAYAYILTNNQLGLPCIFYPDYYTVTGYPTVGMKSKIDELIAVHRQYIFGSSSREYLTRFSTTRSPFFNSGDEKKNLVFQLMGIPSGNDVIVAINYGVVAVDMWVGVNTTGVSEGATFGDRIGNATSSILTVSGGRVHIQLPGRSYAVWVEGQPAVPVELISFTGKVEKNNVLLNWETVTEVNNYGFEVERALSSTMPIQSWENIGFVHGSGNSNSPKDYSFTDNNVTSGKYAYRLKQIDNDGKFDYSNAIFIDVENNIKDFGLHQNYPNPFNPSTKISWQSPVSSWQTLKVYDVLGNEVATLVDEFKPAGSYEVEFSAREGQAEGSLPAGQAGRQLASGVYIYTLTVGDHFSSKKMIFLK